MTALSDNIISAIRHSIESVNQTSAAITRAYEEAEISDDYSDADEMAADHREHLHEEFVFLLKEFTEEYPDLFSPNPLPSQNRLDTST